MIAEDPFQRIAFQHAVIHITKNNSGIRILQFFFDLIQPFSDPVYVNGFLQELKENGISCGFRDVRELELPNIKLPWSE